MNKAWVVGVGMIPFRKPGSSEAYDAMGAQAARLALSDAGIDYRDVQQAYAGFVYGDSTSSPSTRPRIARRSSPCSSG